MIWMGSFPIKFPKSSASCHLKRVPGALFSVNLNKFNRALSQIARYLMRSRIYAMLKCAVSLATSAVRARNYK